MKTQYKAGAVLLVALLLSMTLPREIEHSKLESTAGEQTAVVVDERADRIDAYFTAHKMPLAGYGAKFVAAADANGIDWRLLAGISVKESSGGLHIATDSFNPFGYGSGTIRFNSYDEAITVVSEALGHASYYTGKSTEDKLKTYNPPSVEPLYSQRVINIMDSI